MFIKLINSCEFILKSDFCGNELSQLMRKADIKLSDQYQKKKLIWTVIIVLVPWSTEKSFQGIYCLQHFGRIGYWLIGLKSCLPLLSTDARQLIQKCSELLNWVLNHRSDSTEEPVNSFVQISYNLSSRLPDIAYYKSGKWGEYIIKTWTNKNKFEDLICIANELALFNEKHFEPNS